MQHELKILPQYFEAVVSGKKKFELRKNDRDYKVGDILMLREWDKDYTGNFVKVKVEYILQDCPEYGLQNGYCILSFDRLSYGMESRETVPISTKYTNGSETFEIYLCDACGTEIVESDTVCPVCRRYIDWLK